MLCPSTLINVTAISHDCCPVRLTALHAVSRTCRQAQKAPVPSGVPRPVGASYPGLATHR
jgi:hypothetical protein